MDAPDAYTIALEYLVAGAMPFVIEAEDGMHVMSVFPTNRDTVALMVNPDVRRRLQFMVNVSVELKQSVDEAVSS
jgi:hypothetical protein